MQIYLLSFSIVFFEALLCNEINTTENPQDDMEDPGVNFKIKYIFPGTKWCGAGDNAENYDDLGPQRETDLCCRTHDYCSDLIEAGDTKYNLTNSASYTRLNCDCDDEFYDCLKAANTRTSKLVGKIYFNTLNTQCYRKEYPIQKCVKTTGVIRKKCVEYEYDTTGKKRYQWFDVKEF